MKRTIQRNNPIATVIKNYVNKKSGKVSVSREEIQRRFFGLDWKDQKKVLAAFLEAGQADRHWAYARLLDLWDKSFEPKVLELWEAYHEQRCAWVIIRHFPTEFIKGHIKEFDEDRNYYFICLRLAKEKDFVIEKAKLSKTDYLAVLYHAERTITDEEARNTLYGIVHDCCFSDTYLARLEHVGEGKHSEVITPANYREVNLGIYYLMRMDKDDVVRQFRAWNEQVEAAIYNSPEFKKFQRRPYVSGFVQEQRGMELANLYAYMALDDKYKMSSDHTVDELRQKVQDSLEWARKQQKESLKEKALMFGINSGLPDLEGGADIPPF